MYEDVTRSIRFFAYSRALCLLSAQNSGIHIHSENDPSEAWGEEGKLGKKEGVVALGHNRNDTWENLITNICKGRNYDEVREPGKATGEPGELD